MGIPQTLAMCVVAALLQDIAEGFCVLDNKKGWWLDCGFRDSYLFRIADFGGAQANFDVGFGLGDKEGFPYSIKNTNKHGSHRRQGDAAPVTEEIAQQRMSHPVNFRKPPRGLVPPPGATVYKRQDDNNVGGPPIHILGPRGQKIPIIIKHVTEAPPPSPVLQRQPTIGPGIADLLEIAPETPADTDHVPSFAAKEFIVREAPEEYYPPDYETPFIFPKYSKSVKVPRTKFFCEEQKFLPGIYGDMQLGCKVFHLCVPASMGSRMASYICPNSTLFDQSILQCNWWFNVDCATSHRHYDANLAMAESYRKINAAHLPLSDAQNLVSLSLLSQNAKQDLTQTDNVASRRNGRFDHDDGNQETKEEMDLDSR